MPKPPYKLSKHAEGLLNRARDRRIESDKKYNSNGTDIYSQAGLRAEMAAASQEKTGNRPREWQADLAEALHLGLDAIAIAGTGAGKTLPFILSNLANAKKDKITLIISPLDALEAIQARTTKAPK